MKLRIFISYRRSDNPWAVNHIRRRLVAEFGSDAVFFDTYNILLGEDWQGRLQAELQASTAVVLVYGEAWLGRRDSPGTTARILDEDDPVRFEVREAHRLGKKILPIVIDATPVPDPLDLPEDLRFLQSLHFGRLHATDSLEHQSDELVLKLRSVLRSRSVRSHYIHHALWVAGVALALIWIVRALGLDALAYDFHAKFVQTALAENGPKRPDGFVVAEIGDNDYQVIFNGTTPLDPEVVSIVVSRFLEGAEAARTCGRADAPVGFYADLSPGNLAGSHQAGLVEQALLKLANCRPLVLVCPQSIVGSEPLEADETWVQALRSAHRQGNAGGFPIHFASSAIDPQMLRHSRMRIELGTVVGDVAAGRPPFAGAADSEVACLCPAGSAQRSACNRDGAKALESAAAKDTFDVREVLIPLPIVRRSVSDALLNADEVMRNRVVLFGGGYGNFGRYSVPTLPAGDAGGLGLPGTAVAAFMAHNAAQPRLVANRGVDLLVDLLVAAVTSLLLIQLWVGIAYNPHRYHRRALHYVGVVMVVCAGPVLCVLLAGLLPSAVYLLTNAAAVIVATGVRSALSGYEVLLNGGSSWKTLPELWQATRANADGKAGYVRFIASLLEVLLMAAGTAAWFLSPEI